MTDIYTQILFIIRYSQTIRDYCMENPHKQLIETICTQVLPNMVRIYESGKMTSALDRDQFVTIIEQKIERANKSLRQLPAEEQGGYRTMIDLAYAENIDRLRERTPVVPAAGQTLPAEHSKPRHP